MDSSSWRTGHGYWLHRCHGLDFEIRRRHITGATLAPADVDSYAAAFGGMASAFGNNGWQIAALLLCILIMMMGIGQGIEKANKIMMPLFFLLFVGLAVYIALQPGAVAGYRYIFRVDPVALKSPMTWIYALGQAFFSLSIAGNGTIIYGSYLSDEENIPASAARVAFFDTLAACLRHWSSSSMQPQALSWIRAARG